jgi:hypothetical protein
MLSQEEIETSKPTPEAAVDLFTGNLLAKITQRTPAEVQNSYEEVVRFEVPSNWFQHLKKQLGLRWRKKYLTRIIYFECGWKFPKLARHLKLKDDEYEKYALLRSGMPWGRMKNDLY